MTDFSIIPLLAEFTSPGQVLVRLGPLTIRWYGLLIAIAVLLGVFLAEKIAEQRGLHPDIMGELPLWLVPSAIVGARAYYVLFQWSQYATDLSQVVAIWKGGIAIHGAIIGGILAGVVFAKVKRTSFWRIADCVMPSVALGQAIGRWGNFFNSEAFGAPTDLPWKLYIPAEQRPTGMGFVEYYHPTFLYESLWNLLVFCGLIWLLRRDQVKRSLKAGTIFWVYLLAYSCGRIWIEGLRMDSLMVSGLRIAQLVSGIGIVVGVVGLWWLYQQGKRLPDVVPDEQSPLNR